MSQLVVDSRISVGVKVDGEVVELLTTPEIAPSFVFYGVRTAHFTILITNRTDTQLPVCVAVNERDPLTSRASAERYPTLLIKPFAQTELRGWGDDPERPFLVAETAESVARLRIDGEILIYVWDPTASPLTHILYTTIDDILREMVERTGFDDPLPPAS